MGQLQATAIGGRRDAAAAEDGTVRARWRIAERVISVAIGGAALSGAVYLGVTGPLISPVTPAAVQAGGTADTADTQGGTVPGDTVGDGRNGDRGAPDGRHHR